MSHDARKFAPSAARNRELILAVLASKLPTRGHIIEIASGTGEHITWLAQHYPALTFQPSDPDAESRASVDAWAAHLGLTNVAPAIAIDTTASFAPITAADAVICINMVHISPWAATVGLIQHAAAVLRDAGFLYLYGPYKRGGAHTAPSNAAFDADLRDRNPAWGIRDLDAVAALAAGAGFHPPDVIEMPANNLSLIFPRTAPN